MTYNTATGQAAGGVQTARAGVETVLTAIGADERNGIARPIDVLLLQEQFSNAVSTQSFVDILNGVYGVGTYGRIGLDGLTSSSTGSGGAPSIVYNTQTVQLTSALRLGSVGSGSDEQPRSTLRYTLQPVGYDSAAQLVIYNSHYRSGTGTSDQSSRLAEATTIRNNADGIGEGVSILYAGDFNIRNSSEDMYVELLSSGAGQAFDPIDTPGTWNNNSLEAIEITHTQSPIRGSGFTSTGLVRGGLDDRFDFQLVTGELLDGEGLDYIPGSYHAFGNDASHECCAEGIDEGSGASPAVLAALTTASDHLPVVADYQLPSILTAAPGFDAQTPIEVELGAMLSLPILVSNGAPVSVAIGADELDYTLSTSGALSGSGSGSLLATDAADSLLVTLDASSLGSHSGTVAVTTSSPGSPVTSVDIPLTWEVVSPPITGDYNGDGFITAADYTVWRDSFQQAVASGEGADGNDNGLVDEGDYTVWKNAFLAGASAAVVPEPSTALLSIVMGAGLFVRRSPSRHACV